MLILIALISVWVIYTDISKRVISNAQVSIVFLLTCAWATQNTSLSSSMITLGVVTLFSIYLYAFGIWAGGDAKLLIALSPLFSFTQLPYLLFWILAIGGVVTLFYIIRFRVKRQTDLNPGLPYGVPILLGSGIQFYLNLFAVVSR